MNTSALSALGRRTQAPPISWLMSAALDRPKLISLAAGFTDSPTLPVEETRQIFQELLGCAKAGRAALQYGTTVGDPILRELTARRLQGLDQSGGHRSIWSADRMVITHGSQQLLYMVTEALCDPGDIVLVEDPTYFVFLGILQSHGVRTRGVRLQPDGLDLAHLESTLDKLKCAGELPSVKYLYLVSYFQNPTGTTTSFEKKAGALELLRRYERAAGHRLYLLEDAAYRELRFQGPEVKSALAHRDHESRVIYTGTYSKPFATGTRVGFAWLPDPVLTQVVRIKGNHDFGTSNLLQHLLARVLESPVYETHLAVLRERYAKKAQVMAMGMRKHFPPSVQWTAPRGGMYFWPRLPAGIKTGTRSRLFQAALAKDVLYVPGDLCYGPDPRRRRPAHEMRLSFGSATSADIGEGLRRLGGVLEKHCG